ncbi:MAG: hypothetical protein RLP44_32890 [Aggregatilineales bacterium]
MKRFLFPMLMILLLTITTAAQDDDTDTLPNLTLMSVQNIRELIDIPYRATLSPDGTLLAYEENSISGLCIYSFTDEPTTCTPYPEDGENGERIRLYRPAELKWSPDNHLIALTESSLNDTDIWLYDVQAGTFTNRTQDGYSGRFIDQEARGIPVDLLPTWSPDGSLYFFRYIQQAETTITQLFMIPAVDGGFDSILGESPRKLSDEDPLLVADFTDSVPNRFSFINNGEHLPGQAEVSPDGTKIALIMQPQNPDGYEVWVVNLLDGMILHRYPTVDISAVGLPEWSENSNFVPRGITWTGGTTMIVNFRNSTRRGIIWTAYHIDIETDGITPIFDFANVPQGEYISGTQTDSGLVTYPIPLIYEVLTPDRNYFLYVTAYRSRDSAVLEALPVNGGERLILYNFDADFHPLYGVIYSSIGTDGHTLRALISGYVFTFEITE